MNHALITSFAIAGFGLLGLTVWSSDVLRTEVRGAVSGLLHWTPVNIVANPEGYLDHCAHQLQDVRLKLRASRIEICQAQARIGAALDTATQKVAVGERHLAAAKETYRKAQQAGWPTPSNGETVDEPKLRNRILRLHHELERERGAAAHALRCKNRTEQQLQRLGEASTKVADQELQVETNRQMLKMDRLDEQVTANLVGLRGAMEATLGLTAFITDDEPSLERLVVDEAGQARTREFEALMADER